MKVSVLQSGGFAGLRVSTSVDSASLGPEDARRLRAAVQETKFFDLPAEAGRSEPMPDQLYYEMSVEDGERAHTIRFGEPQLQGPLQSLVTLVVTMPGRTESVG